MPVGPICSAISHTARILDLHASRFGTLKGKATTFRPVMVGDCGEPLS